MIIDFFLPTKTYIAICLQLISELSVKDIYSKSGNYKNKPNTNLKLLIL